MTTTENPGTGSETFGFGDLVTVTYDDGSQVRTWHGMTVGQTDVLTEDRGADAPSHRYFHAFIESDRGVLGARRWERLAIPSANYYRFDAQGLVHNGPDWSIDPFGESVAINLNMTGVSVTAITDEGRAFLRAHENLQGKRNRLVGRLREVDAAAAQELDDLIDSLMSDEYSRGQEDARRW